MMTPLRCEERGGDQERVSVQDVTEDTRLCGDPLGTIQAKKQVFKPAN